MTNSIDTTVSDSEALIVLDGQLKARAANQAFYRTFRIAPEETIGLRVDSLGGRKWDPKLIELLDSVVSGRSQTEHFELIADSEDPSKALFWVSATLVPSGDEERSVLVAFENVAAHRHDKEILAERTQELEAFARSAGRNAHTFNNILTVIAMAADLMRADVPDGSAHATDLDEIKAATKRASDLTKELLNSSRRTLPQPTGLDQMRVGRSGTAIQGADSAREDDNPRDTRYKSGQLTPPETGAERVGGETILLVDDEPALLALARRVLSDDGYRILVAADGAVALRVVAGEVGEIDLVVTDLEMPTLGGRGLVEELNELSPTLKVVFMSGYSDNELLRRGGQYTEQKFLRKPFTPDELRSAVSEALGRPMAING